MSRWEATAPTTMAASVTQGVEQWPVGMVGRSPHHPGCDFTTIRNETVTQNGVYAGAGVWVGEGMSG